MSWARSTSNKDGKAEIWLLDRILNQCKIWIYPLSQVLWTNVNINKSTIKTKRCERKCSYSHCSVDSPDSKLLLIAESRFLDMSSTISDDSPENVPGCIVVKELFFRTLHRVIVRWSREYWLESSNQIPTNRYWRFDSPAKAAGSTYVMLLLCSRLYIVAYGKYVDWIYADWRATTAHIQCKKRRVLRKYARWYTRNAIVCHAAVHAVSVNCVMITFAYDTNISVTFGSKLQLTS